MKKNAHLSLVLAAVTAATSLFSAKAAEASKGDTSKASEKAKITAVSLSKMQEQKLEEIHGKYKKLTEQFQKEQADLYAAAETYLKQEEGYIEHPYLDCNGLIHTGCGINIDNKDVFLSLPFQKTVKKSKTETETKELTKAEKEDYYKTLSALKADQKSRVQKHSADYYKKFAPYTLSEEEHSRLFKEKYDEAYLTLNEVYGVIGFNDLPKSLKLALIDLLYQRGPGAAKEYKLLLGASQKNNFNEMKKQITVKTNGNPGIKKRNEHRQALVEQAKGENRPYTVSKLAPVEAQYNYLLQETGRKPVKTVLPTKNPVKIVQNPSTQKLASARGR